MTLSQAAEATKLRSDHVRALEEGDFSVFSAPVYVRGSIRTYSNLLKLDTAKLIDEVNVELAKIPGQHEPSFSSQSSPNILDTAMYYVSKLNWKIALPSLAAIILIGGVALGIRAWFNHRNQNPLAELKPALYQPTKPSAPTLPLPGPARR